MRIALIYSSYPPLPPALQGDGGADFCRQLATHLVEQGCQCEVITTQCGLAPSTDTGDCGVKVHRIIADWGPAAIWNGQYRRLRDCLANISPDVILLIYPGGSRGFRYVLPALAKVARPRTPVVVLFFVLLLHTYFLHAPFYLLALVLLFLTSSRLCFTSPRLFRYCRKLLPVLRSRIAFIPSGSTLGTSRKYDSTNINALRNRIGLEQNRRYIAFLGGLRRNKNVELFLRACHRVAVHASANVLFIGGPSTNTQLYHRRMLQLIDRLGMTGIVQFTGYLDDEAFLDHALACDICVFPYDERVGRSTYAVALSLGLPIVSVASPWHVHLQHQGNAFLASRFDPETLGQAIQHVLASPQLKAQLAGGALEWAEKLAWNHLAKSWKEMLETTLRPKPAVQRNTDLISNGSC